ncbi:hypothetical protein ETD86_48925 [Nonomuraea turkmeniaca]|uniref:Aminoglycoside phosphotransferase domain-containing protein n=1 Tax=Nonomuraea turkmeniaca TaxID=103838 RepID=A0A5S4EWZ5_9ACTN|nr:phosphotransferase [Nonomuraea turkmeniaca]TMR08171.1 hypothetical protein ETD86_48925 [Nonomuraea turkmeniaca]
MPAQEQDELLHAALATLAATVDTPWPGDGYHFRPVGGGTQATVWHAVPATLGVPEVALRLTPKPAPLITRIGELVNAVDGVERPDTLAVASMEHDGRTWTVHVCTWIGKGAADRSNPHGLGQDIALLHEQLARHGGEAFTDRRLSFERGPIPTDEQQLPAWYVARHVWRDRIYPTFASRQELLRPQPIHGDLHWDNVVAGSNGGFGFIDFDKVMHAPPAFDLAKLLATGFFPINPETGAVRFQQTRAAELLDGYRSVRPLTPAEVAALEGFIVILNEQTAALGHAYDVPHYRAQADAVGGWLLNRRRRNRSDPFGIRESSPASPPSTSSAEQIPLIDPVPGPTAGPGTDA